MKCEWCGKPLPPGRPKRFCEDRCRKRAARANAAHPAPAARPDGPVAAAVRLALAENDGMDGLDRARSELAIAAARAVDAGNVPAMAQLRAVLADLGGMVDDEVAGFLASIQTPRVGQMAKPPDQPTP